MGEWLPALLGVPGGTQTVRGNPTLATAQPLRRCYNTLLGMSFNTCRCWLVRLHHSYGAELRRVPLTHSPASGGTDRQMSTSCSAASARRRTSVARHTTTFSAASFAALLMNIAYPQLAKSPASLHPPLVPTDATPPTVAAAPADPPALLRQVRTHVHAGDAWPTVARLHSAPHVPSLVFILEKQSLARHSRAACAGAHDHESWRWVHAAKPHVHPTSDSTCSP